MTSRQKNVHSSAHSQWNSSTISPMVRGLTWMVVNHMPTPVSAPNTKLTSTSTLKYPSMKRRACGTLPVRDRCSK